MSKNFGVALSLAVLFLVTAVSGQETEKMPRRGACASDTCISKVMYLADFPTPSESQDVVNTLRLILDITTITQNPSEHTVSFQGYPEQVAIAEKIVSTLAGLKSSGGTSRSSVLVYAPQGSMSQPTVSGKTPEQSTRCEFNTCFIKALYLPDFSIRQLQELVNKLHFSVQIARITMFPSCHAIVLQGTSEQFDVVDGVMKE